MPLSIEGLWVESIDSVAGSRLYELPNGFGPAYIWNRVRIIGIGNLRFIDEK